MKFITTCTKCSLPLKKRKTKPATATKDGHKYYDYYQCPKCKTNYSNPKGGHHMKFILWDTKDNYRPREDDDGIIVSDGVLGRIGEDNVNLTIYAEYPSTVRPKDLPVGRCIKDVGFSLSGSKGKYDVYRVS